MSSCSPCVKKSIANAKKATKLKRAIGTAKRAASVADKLEAAKDKLSLVDVELGALGVKLSASKKLASRAKKSGISHSSFFGMLPLDSVDPVVVELAKSAAAEEEEPEERPRGCARSRARPVNPSASVRLRDEPRSPDEQPTASDEEFLNDEDFEEEHDVAAYRARARNNANARYRQRPPARAATAAGSDSDSDSGLAPVFTPVPAHYLDADGAPPQEDGMDIDLELEDLLDEVENM